MKLHANDLGTCGVSQAFYAGTVKFDTEGIADGVKICDIPKGLIFTKAVANVKTAFNAATTNVLTVGFNTDKNAPLVHTQKRSGERVEPTMLFMQNTLRPVPQLQLAKQKST